jgi:hypothetical protein
MPRSRLRSLLLGALLAAACADEPELPPITWTGERVRVGADRPEAICGGSLAELDRITDDLWTRFGADPGPLNYYWLDDLDGFCPALSTGCFRVDTRDLFTRSIPHRHELVHARGPLLPPLLEEGLATYLDGAYPLAALGPRERVAQMLAAPSTGPNTPEDYARARHFVGFVIETFGWPAILELDAVLSRNANAAALEAAFVAATGQTIAQLLALYDAYPDCYGWSEAPLCESLTPIQLAPLGDLTRTIDCSDDATLGPASGWLAYTEVLVELSDPLAGLRQFEFTTTPANVGAFVFVRSCGGCTSPTFTLREGGYTVPADEFPVGAYVLRFYAPIAAGPVEVRFALIQ